MDLVYIPEVLTYGSFRSPLYHDFEQPWNKNYFGHDRSTKSRGLQNKQREQQQQQQQQQIIPQEYHHQEEKKTSKNCHLCRENKRRSLAIYIREKSRRSICREIHEEIEEEIEENEEENQIVDNEINKSIDNIHDIKNDQRLLFKAEEKLANKCMTQK
ncbi:hypothetical protein M0802_010541 [Mischocyttarus mexicanus]|nr:hypothetical protein M0802_010541 [Mischocyttarus mexicanus]